MECKNCSKLWKPFDFDDVLVHKAAFTDYRFAKHAHEEFSIGVINEGAQSFVFKGSNKMVASKECVVTINPDEVHTGEAVDARGYKFHTLFLEQEFVFSILEQYFGKSHARLYFSTPIVHDPELAKHMHRLLTLQEQAFFERLEFESELIEFIVKLFGKHANKRGLLGLKEDKKSIITAKEYMREHASLNPSLEEVSDVVGLSKYYFFRLFKKESGMTPHEYLTIQKLLRVKQHIKEGESLSLIAFNNGFADQSHMNRKFKELFCITPGQFKKAVS